MRNVIRMAGPARTLARTEVGSVSVELALISSFFFALLVGVADFGMALNERGRLESAAHAGALYGATSIAASSDTTGIDAAVRADAGDDGAPTVTSEQFCQCSGAAASCGGTCASGDEPRMYVRVTVRLEHATMFDYPFIPDPWILTHAATMRVR